MTLRTWRRRPRRRLLTAGLAATLLASTASACGSGEAPTPGPTTVALSSSSASTTPFPSSSVSPAGRPTTCVDPVGDGQGDGDLTSVDIATAPDAVRVTWRTTLDAAVLAKTDALYSLDLTRAGPGDEQPTVTFLVKWRDGALIRAFVTRGANDYTDALTPPEVDGTSVTVAFPAEVLSALGQAWTFRGEIAQVSLSDGCAG